MRKRLYLSAPNPVSASSLNEQCRPTAHNAQGHACDVAAELRGLGAAVLKSLEFALVSVQPLLARKSAAVLLKAGAAVLPSKQVAFPKPIKSTTLLVFAFGQVAPPKGVVPAAPPVSAVVLVTSAALPPVVAKLVEPVASAAGRAEPTAPPEPN